MLSVGPGRVSAGTAVCPLCKTASLLLSISVMELLSGLKTMVMSPLGERDIRPGPEETLTVDNESVSLRVVLASASTMLRTGLNEPVPDGLSGFETKARDESPLGRPLPVPVPTPLEELLLQEINATLAKTRTTRQKKQFFKPGTPKSMKDNDLDAKTGIITEPASGIFQVSPAAALF